MNERKALLAAIQAEPGDDTPRLVFADWLDENAESDRDIATAEFIRVSCFGSRSSPAYMGRASYPWLTANWPRLVPCALKLHLERVVRPGPRGLWAVDPIGSIRTGRTIRLTMRLAAPLGSEIYVGYSLWSTMRFEFRRGFLASANVERRWVAERLAPALAVDQPFVKVVHLHNRSLTAYAA